MRKILIIIIIIVCVWGLYSLLKNDEYIGFYYPDVNDLTNDVQSPSVFDSLEMCRDWVDEQVAIYNADNTGYDYECGKNCDTSKGKPYVCEETLE